MKLSKIIYVGLLMALLVPFSTVSAQLTKEQQKERKEILKYSKSQLNDKASKAARKEAKQLKKQGWQVSPGALPLERQLDKAYQMQYELGDDMYPKYIMGEAMSIGENYDAAKMQAVELAKQNLAGKIQTEITALIENSVANEQLSADEANSVSRSILAGKNLISQSIGRTITVTEAYRILQNRNREVMVRVAYDSELSKAAAKRAAKEALEERGDELQKKLDEILGW